MRGESGSEKTTFLRTLNMFIENVEILTILNEEDIKDFISKLDESKSNLRIIIG